MTAYDREFYEWLIAQDGRADPVGKLARWLRQCSVPAPLEDFRFNARELPGGHQAVSEWLDYAWQIPTAELKTQGSNAPLTGGQARELKENSNDFARMGVFGLEYRDALQRPSRW
jgi:hypothetical protein